MKGQKCHCHEVPMLMSCRRETNAPCFFSLRSFLRGSGTSVVTGNLVAKFISCHAHGSFHSLGNLYPVSIDRPLTKIK
jgi:hypothetical protein